MSISGITRVEREYGALQDRVAVIDWPEQHHPEVWSIDPTTRVTVPRDRRARKKERPKPPQLTYTVEEAAEVLGIGRGLAYIMVRDGELPSIRMGQRRLLVPKAALDEWLEASSRLSGSPYVSKHGTCAEA